MTFTGRGKAVEEHGCARVLNKVSSIRRLSLRCLLHMGEMWMGTFVFRQQARKAGIGDPIEGRGRI